MRNKWLSAAVAATAGLALLLAACDDEPTEEEANEAFCNDVGDFLAALGELRDVDEDTSVEEFEETRELVRTTYEDMIQSAQGVRNARIDELNEANENLRAAVDDIDDDASLQEGLDSIEEEADAVSEEVAQMFNDVQCGSGQGGEEDREE
jgi:hypothetical protein